MALPKLPLKKLFFSSFLVMIAVFYLATLPHFGLTWDEPANYLKGDRVVAFLTSDFDFKYLDTKTEPLGITEFDRVENKMFTGWGGWSGHPPFTVTLAGFSNLLFNKTLGWLNHIDAHHLPIVLISLFSIGLFSFSANKFIIFICISSIWRLKVSREEPLYFQICL